MVWKWAEYIYIIIINNYQLFDSDPTENKDVIICDFVFLFKFGPIIASWFVSFLAYVWIERDNWNGVKIVELITLNILTEEVIHRMPKQDETIY